VAERIVWVAPFALVDAWRMKHRMIRVFVAGSSRFLLLMKQRLRVCATRRSCWQNSTIRALFGCLIVVAIVPASFLFSARSQGEHCPEALEGRPLPLSFVLTIATQLAHLLHYLHAQGIICRTLDPSAFYTDHLGRVTCVDLSMAWDEVSPPDSADLYGNTTYSSPEQISGSVVQRRSDIYSYGVLLFELLTGRPPFQGSNRGDLALQHLLTSPPDVRDIRP
jgi:hypothetical protein